MAENSPATAVGTREAGDGRQAASEVARDESDLTSHASRLTPHAVECRAAHRFLTGAFLLFITAVPLAHVADELLHRRPLQELNVFRQAPTLANLQSYERSLERDAVVAKQSRPLTQWLATRFARRGNEKVVVGRDDWLFYRPGINHVVGPGFLAGNNGSGGELSTIQHPKSTIQNPNGCLTAIRLFHESLKARGVDLLLMPLPGKETIYPERLVAGYDRAAGPPVNEDTERFLAELRRWGVVVFDPTDLLWSAKAEHPEPLYLPQDTHWSPTGMARVASSLAGQIREAGYVDGAPAMDYRTERVPVRNRGDIYDMLDLPAGSPLFPATRVLTEKVVYADAGEPCRPDSRSPVLLLGDSFTNVFSTPDLRWGEAAGLAEHLALHLGTGIDVIAQNDGGVNGCRARLARMPSLLDGKRLVIWQFTARDLTLKAGDWQPIRLRSPSPSASSLGAPASRRHALRTVLRLSGG